MKIDVFAHILPEKFLEAAVKKVKRGIDTSGMGYPYNRALRDVDIRLRVMDRHPDVVQVLSVANVPSLEKQVSPSDAIDLARMANDEMAELVVKYPDKFIAAVACLPLINIDAAIKEADRTITEMHFRGVQIFTNIGGEPLDAPKFKPLWERMAHHDLPIWIHPVDAPTPATGVSLAGNPAASWGWPFETTVAMGCLIKAGVFEDYPNIKFITHHCGGLVPYQEGRSRLPNWRKFYNDTALWGNTAGLMCGYAFFGVDHILFGTDAPLGSVRAGYGRTLETIRAIERMDISDIDKDKIFFDNAFNLLKLAV